MPLVQREHAKSDKQTVGTALECIVSIELRIGTCTSAQELVLRSQFESMRPDLLRAVVEGFERLDTPTLRTGLSHANPQIRRKTLNILRQRRSIDRATAEGLCGDTDGLVRRDAITALETLGASLSHDDIRKILVRPQKQPSGNSWVASSRRDLDQTGQELFERYVLEQMKKLSDSALTNNVNDSLIGDDAAYFVRAEKYFRKWGNELRQDVDDRFMSYFDVRLKRTGSALGDAMAKAYMGIEEDARTALTRKALDVLCRIGDRADLERIRTNLREGYTRSTSEDAMFLGANGNVQDIVVLSRSVPTSYLDVFSSRHDGLYDGIAKSMIRVSGDMRVSDLISQDLPEPVLTRVIENVPDSRFVHITNAELLRVLDHESDDVRKEASRKCVRSFTKKRLKETLKEYLLGGKRRYYNVVFWLDLGASMPRKEALKILSHRFG